ncbi:hypothetical protein AVEN_3443-1 [Araneus ventricosus]|uniref:Uncharacterized protein n=1 Tax=Araneus ventricosus TaxID=182803 RepID=A0A4Y2KF35_ARAVE|nr:hypothetical protein AVEN_3443-1 [Araneus ventricosus]
MTNSVQKQRNVQNILYSCRYSPIKFVSSASHVSEVLSLSQQHNSHIELMKIQSLEWKGDAISFKNSELQRSRGGRRIGKKSNALFEIESVLLEVYSSGNGLRKEMKHLRESVIG